MNPHPLTKVRDEWGVMFNDNSVLKGFNGKTAERRAKAEAAKLREKYYPDNIRAVRRVIYAGPWEETNDQSKEE